MRHRRTFDSMAEEGMGLVVVLAIGAALLSMGALASALFMSSNTGSARHVRNEQTIQIAEAGVDQTIAYLQKTGLSYNTDAVTTSSGVVGPLPATVDTVPEELAWFQQVAADVNASELKASTGGQYIALRPSNRKTIYSVGWLPSRQAPQRTRIIKAEYLPATFNPVNAILVGGDLEIQGNANVSGIAGNVHANGTVFTSGGSATISGTLSASGMLDPDPPTASVAGGATAGAREQDIDPVDPEGEWRRNSGLTTWNSNWYDLCGVDGTLRRPPLTASGEGSQPDSVVPCTGTIIADTRGWSYNSGTKAWSYSGDDEFPGIYYAHEANVKLTGNPGNPDAWKATIYASSTGSTGSCDTGDEGDIDIGGTPRITSFIPGLAFLAGRDIELQGNNQQLFNGLFMAHEQIQATGNTTINGSLLAEDVCDTGGSPVSTNLISGSMSLTYDASIKVNVGETVRTTLWLEL